MSAAAVVSNDCRTGRSKQTLRSLGAVIGVFAAISAGTSSVAAQGIDYRSASAAPAAWQKFARQMQSRFQQRLAADDAAAQSLLDDMAKREGDNAPLIFVVRSWVLPDGKIERVEFDGLDDDGVAVNLRALLMKTIVDAPPPDMLQPLHLRLSLGSKNPSSHSG